MSSERRERTTPEPKERTAPEPRERVTIEVSDSLYESLREAGYDDADIVELALLAAEVEETGIASGAEAQSLANRVEPIKSRAERAPRESEAHERDALWVEGLDALLDHHERDGRLGFGAALCAFLKNRGMRRLARGVRELRVMPLLRRLHGNFDSLCAWDQLIVLFAHREAFRKVIRTFLQRGGK